MRKVCITLIILFCVNHLGAQEQYRVIKVHGQIQYIRTGANMVRGDIFPEDEDLSFVTPVSRAAVINPTKGRFILSPDTDSQSSGAKSNFLPAMNNISTRGGLLNSLNDLQDQFSEAIAVIHKASWHINPYEFPMNDHNFFYLTCMHEGKSINKKLSFEENSLLFIRQEILQVDDQAIATYDTPNAIMYYYGPDGPLYISSFNLNFPDINLLTEETRIIIDEFTESGYTQMVNELSGYVFEFYGKPDKQDIMFFMKEQFYMERQ